MFQFFHQHFQQWKATCPGIAVASALFSLLSSGHK